MRAALPSVLLLVLSLSGCTHHAVSESEVATQSARVLHGAAPVMVQAVSPLMTNLTIAAPAEQVGPWAAVYWLYSDVGRGCEFNFQEQRDNTGGTSDTLFFLARGWNNPDVVGRVQHQFSRGDGYVATVSAGGQSQAVGDPRLGGGSLQSSGHKGAIQLPNYGVILVGSTYLSGKQPKAGQERLRLDLGCDGPFRVVAQSNGTHFKATGVEEFAGGAQVDTRFGVAVQQGVTLSIAPERGAFFFLHEDAGNGNAEYLVTAPGGPPRSYPLGNHPIHGPLGEWKFQVTREVGPQAEFRLFSFDEPVPSLREAPQA